MWEGKFQGSECMSLNLVLVNSVIHSVFPPWKYKPVVYVLANE